MEWETVRGGVEEIKREKMDGRARAYIMSAMSSRRVPVRLVFWPQQTPGFVVRVLLSPRPAKA